METLSTLLIIIAGLLFMIWLSVSSIGSRFKERFPTEKERDREWARNDPLGHWEAHKKDKQRN
jgi:hypothetical protein